MSERSKPAGFVVVALYSALAGLAALLTGGADFSGMGFFVAALGVLLLACAYGLWTSRPWARSYACWLYAACIPLGAVAIFAVFPGQRMSAGNTLLQVLGIAIDITIVAYLGKRDVQRLFGLDPGPFADYARREPYLKGEPNPWV